MKTCTFFGSSKAPCSVLPRLHKAIEELIEKEGVRLFFFQVQGEFDLAVHQVLQLMQWKHPEIKYYAVNSSIDIPDARSLRVVLMDERPDHLIHWLLRQAHYVITYVPEEETAAKAYKTLAVDGGRTVIELWEDL